MISPEHALERLLVLGSPVEPCSAALDNAAGRWAAEPVVARRTQPARDLSAMDGYAVRHGPGPWTVMGESAAGAPYDRRIGIGEAVRISTGAVVPKGADTVIIQENVARSANTISGVSVPDNHIRRSGSDFKEGAILIGAGEHLTPARIALAAIGGHDVLPVRRRIRIALISTGKELVSPGHATAPDAVPASNAVMLRAMIAPMPVDVTDLGIVRDDEDALRAIYATHPSYDVMVSTGGASVGDHDLVRPALIAAGAQIDFWKVAMRPGKPLMAGRLGNAIVLGLPGNPASALVTATLFVKPLIAHLSGSDSPEPRMSWAPLADAMPAVGERSDYVRARWDGGSIRPLAGDSGMVSSLAKADALIVRPAESASAQAGDTVSIISLA